MSNKLQNIKAVKEMIAGTHRTQTRKSHYYGSSKSKIKDEDNTSFSRWYPFLVYCLVFIYLHFLSLHFFLNKNEMLI